MMEIAMTIAGTNMRFRNKENIFCMKGILK